MRLRQIFSLACILFLSCESAFAQTDSAATTHTPKSSDTLFENPGRKKTDYVALYFELAGNGVQLSYNLDVRLFSHLSFKAGYGAYAENGPKTFGVLVAMVNYLFFKEQSHIEVGLGTVTELKRDDCGTTVLPTSCAPVKGTAFLGARYQPYFGGFTFRLGYTPFFTFNEYRHNAGLSLGYSFF